MFNINTDTELKHYGFPDINQAAGLIASVNRRWTYTGNDENGDPIYDQTLPRPVLKFVGTTKLHGTNAGVIIDFHNKICYYESRDTVITLENDNAGFVRFMTSKINLNGKTTCIQDEFIEMVMNYLSSHPDEPDMATDWENSVLAIFGEWCGGSIQAGVALNGMEKMFVVLSATIRTRESTESRNLTWFSDEDIKKIKLPNSKVLNIYDFKTWEIEIDFNKFHETADTIYDWTMEVEEMCPFSKKLGVEGIGEGIVFHSVTSPYNTSDFWFKSKGTKHSKSKVTSFKPVDNEKINHLVSVADKITPSWRLEQMFNLTFNTINGGIPSREKISAYLKAVNEDVIKEESLTLEAEGVTYKDVGKYVGKIATDYFFMMEKEFLTNPQ